MKPFTKILLLFLILGTFTLNSQTITKPKVIITTDMGADPDDEQSMVRFLVQSNEFDVRGIIVSTGCWKKTTNSTTMNNYMNPLLNAYECAYPNLIVHAEGFSTPNFLKSITVLGNTGYGMPGVGAGKDSPGSNLIISEVDAATPDNPVWVQMWGGANNLAQALWKVQNTRNQAQIDDFVSKVYCYDILGQDDAGAWITIHFPNLVYIRARSVYSWQRGRTDGWWATHIQSHGCLGAVYTTGLYAMEGDTPAFLHVVGRGLNNPIDTKQRGWGGQFVSKTANIPSMSPVTDEGRWGTYYMYGNSLGPEVFSQTIENDFQARMDWSINSNFSDANHHPVVVLNGDTSRDILKIYVQPGQTIQLSANGTTDPDNNSLSYQWSYYQTDGNYGSVISISNSTSQVASITVPANATNNEMHFVVAVTDNGIPALTSYRRAIVVTGQSAPDDPIVDLILPDDATSFELGESITIEATATVQNGAITNVEFFVNGTSIGIDNLAPYTISYTPTTYGLHTITAIATDSDGDTGTKVVSISVNMPQGPYNGIAHTIPGKIELEHFDVGGNGFAYSDNTTGNTGGADFRMDEDVDIEDCSDDGNGYNLGWTAAGEWLEYTVNVETSGEYKLTLRVACNGDNRTVSLSSDGNIIANNIAIPNTTGWQEWVDVETEVSLNAGQQVLRLTIGNVDYVNLNYMSFELEQYSTQTIQLYTGWNLIGSPLNGSESIENALSSILQCLEVVKDMNGYYMFNNQPEFNSLQYIKWGQGYYIKVSQDCELNWIINNNN
jgi:hypothetical protein